jgi:hypothetical protein
MRWVEYSGQPFEGERIFKITYFYEVKSFNHSDIHNYLKLYERGFNDVFYLDESPSYSIEDMREAFEDGYNAAYGSDAYSMNFDRDEWIKEREGK